MEYGIAFPTMELKAPEDVRAFARGAESLGFHQITTLEHTLGVRSSETYSPDVMIHEPMVLFGYLAAVTDRIRFANSILILPQRQAVLVARQAAEIDVLSDGRVTLGIGIGSNAEESAGMGADYTTRGARVEEQIRLMRMLWTGREISFHGRWHDMESAGLTLLPKQRPIPLFMGGGHGKKPLERIGRLADGWIAPGSLGPNVVEQIAAIRDASVAAGRSKNSVLIQGRMSLSGAKTDSWLATAQGWRDLGAQHLVVNTSRAGLTSASPHLRLAERFLESTVPYL